jgi:serine/threonine-protein kinase RsbW
MDATTTDLVKLDLPANYRSLSVLSACIRELLVHVEGLNPDAKLIYGVQLAAHEVCTNIVEHAYGMAPDARINVAITLAPTPRRIEIELLDHGKPFDMAAIAEPDLSEPREEGYGLYLIRTLMDEVSYTPHASGNRWTLVKQL